MMPPGADQRGQAGDGADGHPAAEMALEAVIKPDQRGRLGRVAAREGREGVAIDPRDRGDPIGRVFLKDARAKGVGPDGRSVHVVNIGEAVAPNDVHHAQGQRGVGAGAGLDVPVGPGGCRAPIRVDRDDRGPRPSGLDHQAPQVAVGVRRVGAPVDDEPALGDRHRIGPEPASAQGVFIARRASRGADRPVQLGGPQAVKEPPVKAARLELPHRPVIAVRKDRLRPRVRSRQRREPRRDLVERLVPSDPLEAALALGPDSSQGVQQPIRAVDPVQIPGHFLAEEPTSEGMLGISPQILGNALADSNDHATGVRAVEGAHGLDPRRARFGGGHGESGRWGLHGFPNHLSYATMVADPVPAGPAQMSVPERSRVAHLPQWPQICDFWTHARLCLVTQCLY